jgi:hypothetical protein
MHNVDVWSSNLSANPYLSWRYWNFSTSKCGSRFTTVLSLLKILHGIFQSYNEFNAIWNWIKFINNKN